ncbi:hypothetical protein MIR68_002579 [Amoeboaphelidium protococcarum]|nr:hypothetical protein MIR68_002579 [Amoeboaphelidium protococcarum]
MMQITETISAEQMGIRDQIDLVTTSRNRQSTGAVSNAVYQSYGQPMQGVLIRRVGPPTRTLSPSDAYMYKLDKAIGRNAPAQSRFMLDMLNTSLMEMLNDRLGQTKSFGDACSTILATICNSAQYAQMQAFVQVMFRRADLPTFAFILASSYIKTYLNDKGESLVPMLLRVIKLGCVSSLTECIKILNTVLITSCMIANDFLDDNAYSTRTWSAITGVACRSLATFKRGMLLLLDWDLKLDSIVSDRHGLTEQDRWISICFNVCFDLHNVNRRVIVHKGQPNNVYEKSRDVMVYSNEQRLPTPEFESNVTRVDSTSAMSIHRASDTANRQTGNYDDDNFAAQKRRGKRFRSVSM